jgi:two-component system response regulator QseB
MRLLLVEDDEMLGKAVKAGLRQGGYTVDWVSDGESAMSALANDSFDVVVLDIGLPDMSGINVLQKIRKQQNDVPVMILTAYDTVSDRVAGLDQGADDYMTKPFDLDEMLARLRAITRRKSGRSESQIQIGELCLDTATHRLTVSGKEEALTNKEFQLLEYLMSNVDKVVQRDRLEAILYGWEGTVESNSLEVYIHNLRKKIGAKYITTIRGAGYRMESSDH